MSEGTKQWITGMVVISGTLLIGTLLGQEEVNEMVILVALAPLVGQWFRSRGREQKS